MVFNGSSNMFEINIIFIILLYYRRPSYQYLQQLLKVAGDESVVFMKCPATLLRIIPVAGKIAEDHLQPLFVITHLALRQCCTQILQRHKQLEKPAEELCLSCDVQSTTYQVKTYFRNVQICSFMK